VKAGGVALTFLIVATPVGWIGLIVGGIVVAGVAATSSILANNLTQDIGGSLYDVIMNWVDSL